MNIRYYKKPKWLFIILINTFAYARGETTALSDTGQTPMDSIASSGRQNGTIYFRWDKEHIDPTYLTNATALHTIDSVLSRYSTKPSDTLFVTAFASPEGSPLYNQKLSQKRAESFREYLLTLYPWFAPSSVLAQGKGEDWEGFRRLAQADLHLPRKTEILSIIDNPTLTLVERQAKIVALDGGRIYSDYIYPRYYPQLRYGASLFVGYNPARPVEKEPEPMFIAVVAPKPEPVVAPKFEPLGHQRVIEPPQYRYTRPFALKTNLLFDAVTLFNAELEVPIGRRISVLGEWVFPFWGGLGNRGGVAPLPVYSEHYTLQMLSAGVEVRYWFKRSDKLNDKAQRWGDYNPLCGWFVGPYAGIGWYDFQLGKEGVQGESHIAVGVSGGYAHPIGKYVHMEYSIGVGYMQTQYRRYEPIEGHKVYQYDGRYSWIGPTKAKVSLVWIPRFMVSNKRRCTK